MRPIELLVRTTTALLAAALIALPAAAADLFTLRDPRGDDHGDGSLIYPLNEELDPGDLDLVSLTAGAGKGGTWFEATFARPVRVPEAEVVDDLGTSLKSIARFGFYTFNLDIYIDTDRVPDSGGFKTLPGRHAEIDRASAWERAIVLTPRPHEARGELKRMLARDLSASLRETNGAAIGDAQAAELRAQIPGDVDTRIFFPHQVRVRGNAVRFFVPESFLGGPAQDTWSYVVAVSGADVMQAFDLNRVLGRSTDKEESLMILPISPGKWHDRFGGGRENAPIQPPLVDIVVPAGGRSQESILSDFDARGGRPVVLPGVVPAEVE